MGGRGAHAAFWRHLVDDLDLMLGRYMRSLLILSLAASVAYAIAFSIVGMPYGLLLAGVAGCLEFIPVAGPLAAAVFALAVAALTGFDHLLLLALFLAVYRLFQDYVLNPILMSGGVAVPPLLVLFGLLAGEEIGGIVGIFLAVPVLAIARIVVIGWRTKRACAGPLPERDADLPRSTGARRQRHFRRRDYE